MEQSDPVAISSPGQGARKNHSQTSEELGYYQAEKELKFPTAADASWASANNTGKVQHPTELVQTQRTTKNLQKNLWDHSPSPWQQSHFPQSFILKGMILPEHLPERDNFKPKGD